MIQRVALALFPPLALCLSCGVAPASAQANSAALVGVLDSGAASAAGASSAAGTDFDFCVPPGVFFFNTASQTITGGPDCSNTTTVTVLGGVLEVDDFSIAAGGVLKVTGPNPLVVIAHGQVTIDGHLDLSGSDSPGVLTLNTTNIPETGAPGQAGGGRGGYGSPGITTSSAKGGDGNGAYDRPGLGGVGGETGWSNTSGSQVNARRGAGGGGGVLGRPAGQSFGSTASFGDWDQSYIGLDAESGFPNLDPASNGALSGAAGPFGGAAGPSPFVDADPANDFYGVALELSTGALITGELAQPWAGAGGGAGGDASWVGIGGSWPPPFNPQGDEKGAAGAGGGGALHVLALGDIVFGPAGLIESRGGSGGGGENTLFLNRVGGGSGGGSGGHVILETAGRIDLSRVLGPGIPAGTLAGGILATGGEGGAGKSDTGGATVGANGKIEQPPHLDACPPTSLGTPYPTSGRNACLGQIDGAGGDGGPGLIQLHTRNGLDPNDPGILLPPGLFLADVCEPAPVGLREGLRLVPRMLLGDVADLPAVPRPGGTVPALGAIGYDR